MQQPEVKIHFTPDQDIVDDQLRAISCLTPPFSPMEESNQRVSSDLRIKLNQALEDIMRSTQEMPV